MVLASVYKQQFARTIASLPFLISLVCSSLKDSSDPRLNPGGIHNTADTVTLKYEPQTTDNRKTSRTTAGMRMKALKTTWDGDSQQIQANITLVNKWGAQDLQASGPGKHNTITALGTSTVYQPHGQGYMPLLRTERVEQAPRVPHSFALEGSLQPQERSGLSLAAGLTKVLQPLHLHEAQQDVQDDQVRG
jgi:hypothetical protein